MNFLFQFSIWVILAQHVKLTEKCEMKMRNVTRRQQLYIAHPKNTDIQFQCFRSE